MRTIHIIFVVTLLCFVNATPHERSTANKEDVINLQNQSAPVDNENTENNSNLLNAAKHSSTLEGQKVSISQFPYTAAIVQKTAHFASAVVLNKKWLLTSAWALKFEEISTTLIRTGSSSAVDKGQYSWVDKTIIHPKYKQTWGNDVGLIKLKKPLKFDQYTKAIKITNKTPKQGIHANFAGFGLFITHKHNHKKSSTNHDGWLRAATLQVVSNKNCKKYYHKSPLFRKSNFCTKPTTIGPCDYENGSPLVHNNELIGIFSGVPECVNKNYPPVYTDISQFKKWVDHTIKAHSDSEELADLYTDIEYYKD